MKLILRITASLLLALLAAACAPDRGADEPRPETSDAQAVLSLRVGIADAASRAPKASSVEAMRQLRVVILRPGGEVEVNYLADFGTTSPRDYFGIFRLRPGEDKKIYAIANPASTGFPFDSYPEGSMGIEKALEEYEYEFAPSLPIAMTDSRDIPAATLLPGQRADVGLNVVRVAAKFSVTIRNLRDEDVTLRSFSVSTLAGREYLMPHFTGSTGLHIVSSRGLEGFDFGTAKGLHWSDWLRLAVDESQAAPSDTLLADERGWIMKYAVPDNASHARRDFALPDATLIRKGATASLPDQYFAESRSGLKQASDFGLGAAAGLEQSYTYSVAFSSTEGGDKTFSDQPFPNLRALFRNTHVTLLISIYQEKVVTEVSVLPYVSITLEPGFGWDTLPEPETGDDRDPNIPSS